MTEIVRRYATVKAFLTAEDADPVELAGPEDPFPWDEVDLSADALRPVGAPSPRRAAPWAAQLDLLQLYSDGTEDGIDLTGMTLLLELRQPRGGIVQVRRSDRQVTSDPEAAAQIEADADQNSRNADPEADPPVPAGNRGRLVVRWHAEDDSPPPEGSWSFTLTGGAETHSLALAAGTLEVVR